MFPLNISMTAADYAVVALYFIFAIAVGFVTKRSSGENLRGYFLSGQRLSWWLLGTSMVATTFALDTPLYVAGFTREIGIQKNWEWWVFLFGGMFTTFFFARLWRRCDVLNDAEFIDLRYSGKEAAFLRGFRALYMGFIMNMLVIGSQLVAISKVGTLILGIQSTDPNYVAWQWGIAAVCGITALLYCGLSGFGAIVITDFVQFALGMLGSILLAVFACRRPEVGGLGRLVEQLQASSPEKLEFLPRITAVGAGQLSLLVVIGYACVRWWSQVYGGAEPGGQAHVAQRMLAARNEQHALLGSLWFNFANYALKPMPWIVTALATLLIVPLARQGQDHEAIFLSTINFVPIGLRGLVVASLVAAFMSTIDTRINLGASYFVNDFYRPFIARGKPERHYVAVARWVSVLQFLVGMGMLLIVTNMRSVFFIYAGLGSGAGLVYILRFYWWRISAWSELSAMAGAFALLVFFRWGVYDSEAEFNRHGFQYMFISFGVVTVIWVTVTLLTKPCDPEKLREFYRKVRPAGPWWKPVTTEMEAEDTGSPDRLSVALIGWLCANLATLSCLFTIGKLLLGDSKNGILWTGVWLASSAVTVWAVRHMRIREHS